MLNGVTFSGLLLMVYGHFLQYFDTWYTIDVVMKLCASKNNSQHFCFDLCILLLSG